MEQYELYRHSNAVEANCTEIEEQYSSTSFKEKVIQVEHYGAVKVSVKDLQTQQCSRSKLYRNRRTV